MELSTYLLEWRKRGAGVAGSRVALLIGLLLYLFLLRLGPAAQAQPAVIETITVGGHPAAIALNPTTNRFYVGLDPAAAVAVVDMATNTVITSISTAGFQNLSLAANPVTNRIYIGQQFAAAVLVVDGLTDTPITNVPVGGVVSGVVVNPHTDLVYVGRPNNADILVMAGAAPFAAVGTISLGVPLSDLSSMGMAVDATTDKIYILDPPKDRLAVIDGVSNSLVTTVPVGDRPLGVGVNTITQRAYVANNSDDTVTVVDLQTNTPIATIPVGDGPVGVAVNEATNWIYVANNNGNDVSVIDGNTDTVVDTVAVGNQPAGVAIDPNTNLVYVANNLNGTVSVIKDEATDTTPPDITPNVSGIPGNDDWYISNIEVSWSVTDPESGIVDSIDCEPVTLTDDTTGMTLTCSATNGAGLSNSASVTIKLDKTAPQIIITAPADGGSYLLNEVVVSDYSCLDETSGLADCSGPVVSGADFSTSPVGNHTFTVIAGDLAGNQVQASHTYSILYDFNGFFPPVDNLPVLNRVKAGSAVPIKFSLNGDQGLDIFEAGFPVSQQISCDSSADLNDVVETVTSGESGLTYDATADQYIYVWKTKKEWANTCRQLTLKLKDDSAHITHFEFVK